ncbi:MAG: photosystem II repair protein Psb32 [Geitlerinemataceae cyanobacterium]
MISRFTSLRSQLATALFAAVFALAAIALPVSPALATGIYDLPFVSAGDDTWTIDDADVLSRITENNLAATSKELRDETGVELRYVAIRRLDYGETIDSFADGLFAAWFSTPEASANQVLVALDVVTNNAAVRKGEAVGELLSTEIADSVAETTMVAPLIDGNKYNQAFGDVRDRLIAVISGQEDPGAVSLVADIDIEGSFATAEETEASRSDTTTLVIVLLVLATVIPMATYYVLYL